MSDRMLSWALIALSAGLAILGLGFSRFEDYLLLLPVLLLISLYFANRIDSSSEKSVIAWLIEIGMLVLITFVNFKNPNLVSLTLLAILIFVITAYWRPHLISTIILLMFSLAVPVRFIFLYTRPDVEPLALATALTFFALPVILFTLSSLFVTLLTYKRLKKIGKA